MTGFNDCLLDSPSALSSELKLIAAKARLFRTVKMISPDYELECLLELMRWERRLSFAISRFPSVRYPYGMAAVTGKREL